MAGTGSRKGISYKILPSRRNWVLNAVPVLLIHCDGVDGGTTFTDSGPTGHTITANGTAQIDSSGKFCEGLLLDGDSDYLTLADHANWDIGTNFTTDMWIYYNGTLGSDITFIHQYEDDDNLWELYYDASESKLRFDVLTAGDTVVTLTGGVVAVYEWVHIALCKVGDEYGLYINGTQTAHTSDADTDTFAGSLYIGVKGKAGAYFIGWMDEIRIVQSNPFGAAPVVGLTDTIAVPCKPYISWS